MEEGKKYPLDQLAAIKQRRLEEAEKVLADKKSILAKEEEQLAVVEKERDEVKSHRDDKLQQFRSEMDAGMRTDKMQQMRQYLKLVNEKLKVEETKVLKQQQVVEAAEKAVETARQDLFKKQKDIEKLNIHKDEWKREMRYMEEHRLGNENDEMGSAIHNARKKKKE